MRNYFICIIISVFLILIHTLDFILILFYVILKMRILEIPLVYARNEVLTWGRA